MTRLNASSRVTWAFLARASCVVTQIDHPDPFDAAAAPSPTVAERSKHGAARRLREGSIQRGSAVADEDLTAHVDDRDAAARLADALELLAHLRRGGPALLDVLEHVVDSARLQV